MAGRPFLALKAVVETLLAKLHAPPLEASAVDAPWFTIGRAAELKVNGLHLGYLGEISRDKLDSLSLRADSSAAELDLTLLIELATLVPQHQPMPPFPAVDRDLSLVVDRLLPWSDLSAEVTAAAGPTLIAIDFLDAFQGGGLPAAKHSLHFGLRFQHPDRTLTGEEVDRSLRSVVAACATRFDATLR